MLKAFTPQALRIILKTLFPQLPLKLIKKPTMKIPVPSMRMPMLLPLLF